MEVDALKSEIDRISTATEYNGMALLDGSLGGSSGSNGQYGPKFGEILAGVGVVTSNVKGIKVSVTGTASGTTKGSEFATWSEDGKTLNIGLVADKTYTQSEIDDLLKNANQSKGATVSPATVGIKLDNGIITVDATGVTSAAGTVAGTRGTTAATDLKTAQSAGGTASKETLDYSNKVQFTRNTYGANDDIDGATAVKIITDSAAGKESAELSGTDIKVHLATGVEYTEADIENIMAKAGYDFEVKLTSDVAPNGDANGVTKFTVSGVTVNAAIATDGTGVPKSMAGSTGEGLVFQIGANGVADQRVTLNVDDMSSAAIGVANADVSTRDAANEAIEMVDKAVKTVSMQRAGLGAMQNRLEYTVNNLTTTNENLTNAESQIRDTDMATEMINYTKFNILQQASQAMLAQANQQPQAVLQLLG